MPARSRKAQNDDARCKVNSKDRDTRTPLVIPVNLDDIPVACPPVILVPE
jgi:hypothetical protein